MARRRRYSEEPFGPTIEALMGEAGVTYRELAARTGLSAGYLASADPSVIAEVCRAAGSDVIVETPGPDGQTADIDYLRKST